MMNNLIALIFSNENQNRMKTLIILFVCMLWVLSCQRESQGFERGPVMDSKDMAPAMEESQSYEGGSSDKVTIVDQKIIRHGDMTIKVDDALKFKAGVDAILKNHKAYIGNEQFNNSDYVASYHVQIRVPSENLDALVAELEAMDGIVESKSINATDVTQEYIDLEIRLANKRSYVEQYREILKSARTVEDILKVREQIRVLEEEIESAEGRLKFLRNQVSLSTLNLTITQEKDFVYRPDRKINFFERLKDSFSAGWYGFVQFCLGVVGLWPFWLALVVLIWLLRKYTQKKRISNIPPS